MHVDLYDIFRQRQEVSWKEKDSIVFTGVVYAFRLLYHNVILPESWTMSLVKEIQLNLLNHDKKNAKKIQPGIQGQGGFRSCKKSKNACRIEPAF